MAVPVHMKIVFRGLFDNTPEEWSFSTKFSRDNAVGGDADVSDVHTDQIDTAVTAFLGGSRFSSHVKTTEYRIYSIGPDGLAQGDITRREFTTPISGSAAADYKYPTDTSICVTTLAVNRGAAQRGRFYLPMTAQTLANDARLSTTEAGDILTQTVNFLKAVSDSIDLEPPQSSEMLNISRVGAGARQVVDKVRVGRVLDRIERRRRSMLEEYEDSGTIDW